VEVGGVVVFGWWAGAGSVLGKEIARDDFESLVAKANASRFVLRKAEKRLLRSCALCDIT
jgi:hypothetical protein